MRRLLLLICALMMLTTPSPAQEDDGSYPEPSYPETSYPEPSYPEPQATGYGTINFVNQTAFQIDFYIDGTYACRAWANSSCSAQAYVGTRSVSGKTVENPPHEQSDSVEVGEGGTSTWTLSGGGTPDTGGGTTTPSGPGYGTVTFVNQTVFTIDFYIDGSYACRAMASGSCTAQASPGAHSVSGRTDETPPREESSSIDLGDGGETTWTLSGGGAAPTGYGAIEVKNGTALQLDAYLDGTYACRAEPASSCTAQASVGRHTVTVRTVAGTSQESTADGVEVYDGVTTPVEFSGGGAAPTGYGSVEFDNGTALEVEFMIDGTFACRANPHDKCTAQSSVGQHTVTARTLGPNPQELAPQTLEVADGGVTSFGITGGGAPASAADPALPPIPAPSVPSPPATSGTVVFENQSMYLVTFDIDGTPACRAPAHDSCSADAAPGRHAITARTLSDPPYRLDAVLDVTAGAVTRYAIGNAANAKPAR